MQNMLARQTSLVGVVAHWAEDLGCNYDTVARRAEVLERAAQNFFAYAVGIDIGGVEEIDAELEGAAQEGAALFFLEYPFPPALRAIGHDAEADARDFDAGRSKIDVVHDIYR